MTTKTEIKASEIKPGMVIKTSVDERINVEKVSVKWGAVQIRDNYEWRGLGLDEVVEVLGHFNP